VKISSTQVVCHIGLTDFDIHAIATMIANGEYESKQGTTYTVRWRGKRLTIAPRGMEVHIREAMSAPTLRDVMPAYLRHK
jgi:hypothetical protein